MKNPLTSLQEISPLKAVFLAGMILAGFLMLSLAIQIPSSSEDKIKSQLRNAGFSNVTIGAIDYHLNGIEARDIQIDPYGLDKIQTLRLTFSWPSFLMSGKLKEVYISGLSVAREADYMPGFLHKAIFNLLSIAQHRVVIEDATLVYATTFGDLRFVVNAAINPPDDNNEQKINATIAANQFQLGFNNQWSGKITKDGKLDLTSEILDGRLHFGPVTITRFGGWMALEASEKSFSVQSQMDAGGADFFKVPLQDISLVAEMHPGNSTMLFRSFMAGMKDVSFNVDLAASKDAKTFQTLLKGNNLSAFLKRLAKENNLARNVPKALDQQKSFSLLAAYQPDRRFAGGPLPFTLDFSLDQRRALGGNFLIYADTMDIRGSAETDKAMAGALQNYFQINSKNLDGNFFRLDGNIRSLFSEVKKAQ